MPNRADVIAEARTWLGVPWKHQGRTRRGVDCAGVVVCVAVALGLSAYDTKAYQRRTHSNEFLRHFREAMDEKPVSEAQPGDVMLFRDSAYPCHSAIIGERDGELTIIHGHAMHRKVLEERLSQGDWMQKRVACFQFRGLEG